MNRVESQSFTEWTNPPVHCMNRIEQDISECDDLTYDSTSHSTYNFGFRIAPNSKCYICSLQASPKPLVLALKQAVL
jgi:hypothetical protein